MSQRQMHRVLNGKACLLLRLHFKFTRLWPLDGETDLIMPPNIRLRRHTAKHSSAKYLSQARWRVSLITGTTSLFLSLSKHLFLRNPWISLPVLYYRLVTNSLLSGSYVPGLFFIAFAIQSCDLMFQATNTQTTATTATTTQTNRIINFQHVGCHYIYGCLCR